MKNKIIVLIMSLSLQGCNTFFGEKYDKDNLFKIDPKIKTINSNKQKPFTEYNENYLGTAVSYTSEQKRILDTSINIDSYEPVNFLTVLGMLQEQAGLTYKFSNGLDTDKNTKEEDNTSYHIKYQGKLSGFISYISVLYDINIELSNENILLASIYKNHAIKLDVYAQDGQYETSLDIGSNEGTLSSGFSGNTSTKFTSSFWQDIEKLVQNNVSSGVYTIFKDASILTFTGKNSEYANLKKIISDYQEENGKQFVVSYKIYIIDKAKIKNLDASLGVAFNKSGTSIGFNNGLLGKITDTGISIDSDFSGGADPKFKLGAQLEALYKLTGKQLLQSGTFVTKNNIPIPLSMTNSENYISGRTQSLTNSSGDSSNFIETQVTTETLTTGTSFIITPRVMSNGNIEVVSGFTRSTLNGFEIAGKGTNTEVMLPNISSIQMFNTSLLRPGSIAVVGEFDSEENSDDSSIGIFSYGRNDGNKNNTTVMVIGVDYYNNTPVNDE
ncbi:type II and III secretion system protein [Proteus mirabilis]|uniref:type II and III secretion system protein n=1 Tax=Proteus mirabilis TaxID=584 RepID=UPI0034E548B0